MLHTNHIQCSVYQNTFASSFSLIPLANPTLPDVHWQVKRKVKPDANRVDTVSVSETASLYTISHINKSILDSLSLSLSLWCFWFHVPAYFVYAHTELAYWACLRVWPWHSWYFGMCCRNWGRTRAHIPEPAVRRPSKAPTHRKTCTSTCMKCPK